MAESIVLFACLRLFNLAVYTFCKLRLTQMDLAALIVLFSH